jgi:hypothetical protein
MTINTDRKKVLQTGALMRERAMRAVSFEVLPARRTPLSSPQASRIDQESSKQPQTPFVAEDHLLGGRGA